MKAPKVTFAVIPLLTISIPAIAHATTCSDGSTSPTHATRPESHEEPEKEECIERNIFLMPGVYSVLFQPTAHLGAFYGGGVQLAPYQWSHNNDHFGPSQGSLFVQAALLRSASTSGTMAMFEAGGSASFERNSSRRWLIPYFGGTLGAISQTDLGTSTYVYPNAGVHLYWHHNLMVDAEGGYHFPFEDIDHMKGPRAQLAARFSLW